jgi:hypothetical protein
MHASTDVEQHIHLEMPLDHVMAQFVEAQPEAWKQAHLVCRYDRHHGYVVGFTAAALDTLVQYVTTQAIFGSEAERNFYASELRWRVDHDVSQPAHTPYQSAHAPEVLPNQLPLL